MIRTAIAAVLLLAGCREPAGPEPLQDRRPDLALLTSLPVAFAESFSLEPPNSPLLKALEQRFAVRPVDGPEQLKAGGVLLAIQPQALTAERLVALDRWVREGGRLVLLADPSLTWESSRPLGDRFRPPISYPDTGLLRHWGLTLERETAPFAETVPQNLGQGISVEAASFGTLVAAKESGCRLSAGGKVARCRVGKGRVTVVADADFAMREAIAGTRPATLRRFGETDDKAEELI